MKNGKWKRKTGIMLALDVKNASDARRLMDKVHPVVDAVKFNYPLVLNEGVGLMGEIKKKYGKPVLADFKIADVPVTNGRIIKIIRKAGADAAMIHGFVGIDALKAARKAAGGLKLFLMTQLTNPGGMDFYAPYTATFARLAKTLGFAGIQSPGNRPEEVAKARKIVGNQMIIISCGIGRQGGKFGGAIRAGADFEIIGRAIYEAKNPPAKIRSIAAGIKPFL